MSGQEAEAPRRRRSTSRARRLALAIGGLTLVVVLVGAASLQDVFFEAWYLWRLESGDAEKQQAAARWFIEHPAPEAVVPLMDLELARIQAAGGGEEAEVVYSSFRPQDLPKVQDSLWVEAVRACGSEALLPLFQCYRESPDHSGHVTALVESIELDAPAAVALVEVIEDEELARLRAIASYGLYHLGRDATHAVPRLLEATRASSASARQHALIALRGIVRDVAPILPQIERLLSDDAVVVRAEAAFSLGHYGEASPAGLSSLERLLSDEDANLKHTADWAIQQIRSKEGS